MGIEADRKCPPHTSIFYSRVRAIRKKPAGRRRYLGRLAAARLGGDLEHGAAVKAIVEGAAEIRCAIDIYGRIDDYAVGIETLPRDVAEVMHRLLPPPPIR